MQVKINGQVETFSDSISLMDLVEQKALKLENCVILRNGNVIEKTLFSGTCIVEGDDLTLLSFVGGG